MPDAMLATPPCAGLRDERAALPSPRAALGMASPPWPARDVRPPPRVSVLRGMIALWKPSLLSLPAASGQRGLAQRMRSPARRVPLPASRMAVIGPFLLLAVLQASPHRSQPSATYTYLYLSWLAASHSACASACPARFQLLPPTSGSLSHSRPAFVPAAEVMLPTRSALGSFLALRCSPDPVAVAVPMCGGGRWQPLFAASFSLTQPHCTCDCPSHLVSPCTSEQLAMLVVHL